MKNKIIPNSFKHFVNVLVIVEFVLLGITFPKFSVFSFPYYNKHWLICFQFLLFGWLAGFVLFSMLEVEPSAFYSKQTFCCWTSPQERKCFSVKSFQGIVYAVVYEDGLSLRSCIVTNTITVFVKLLLTMKGKYS